MKMTGEAIFFCGLNITIKQVPCASMYFLFFLFYSSREVGLNQFTSKREAKVR